MTVCELFGICNQTHKSFTNAPGRNISCATRRYCSSSGPVVRNNQVQKSPCAFAAGGCSYTFSCLAHSLRAFVRIEDLIYCFEVFSHLIASGG